MLKKINTVPYVNTLINGMHLLNYPRIGNPSDENRVNKKEIERLIRDTYAADYNENIHNVFFEIINRFEENREPCDSLITQEKIKYLHTHNFLENYDIEKLIEVLDIVDDLMEQTNCVLKNGERLEFYLRMLKFLRVDVYTVLEDTSISLQNFVKGVVNHYLTKPNDIYDLVDRAIFLEKVMPYIENEKYTYYQEKTVGDTEAEHMIVFIEIIENMIKKGEINEQLGEKVIEMLVMDYEYASILCENYNHEFMQNEGKRFTRNTWSFISFGLAFLLVGVYFLYPA